MGAGEYPETILVAAGYRITFVYPIRAEIIGNVEHFHVFKTHGAEFLVSGIDVWAIAPGTAPAIDYDGSRARQTFQTLAELLNTV